MSRCPICGKDAAPRSKNPAAPFCAPRCRQIDLGKWLNEDYRVAGPSSDAYPRDGDGGETNDGASADPPQRGDH